MRVLVFGAIGSKITGIDNYLLNMSSHMGQDCVFDYVILGDKCVYKKEMEATGSKITYVTSYGDNPFKSFFDYFNVIRRNRKSHPVAYFNLFSMVHCIPIVLTKVMGYKVVLHSHNNDIDNKSKLYRFAHVLSRTFLAGSRRITRLACSPQAGQFMFGRNRDCKVVYNAIDVKRFKYDERKRKDVRGKLGVNDDTFLVGFVGRIEPQKNPIFLSKIYNELCKLDSNCKMLVVGDGFQKKDLINCIEKYGIQDRMIFVNPTKNIEDFYSAMDAFCLPSRYEGLGIVLIEAQASGLRCFTSDVVVPKEAKVTELLEFISLEKSPRYWAERILRRMKLNRSMFAELVSDTRYNIEVESKKLEDFLTLE